MNRFHSPCVTSYLPIQKPLLNVTSTWSSPGRRSGSLAGLPMTNRPAGHQQTFTPTTSRSSPALEPLKGDTVSVTVVAFCCSTDSARWQPRIAAASRMSKLK